MNEESQRRGFDRANDYEISLIGLVPDSELKGFTNEKELKRIICDSLGITPMLSPLMTDLQRKNLISDGGTI